MKYFKLNVIFGVKLFNQIFYIALITCILFQLNYLYFEHSLLNLNEKKLHTLTKGIEKEIESRIESKLKNYLDQNLHKYSRSSEYSVFYHNIERTQSYFTDIRISLVDNIRMHPYISDLTLYRIDDGLLVSAKRSGHTFDGLNSTFDDIKQFATIGAFDKAFLYKNSSNRIIYIYPVIQNNRMEYGPYRGFASLYISNPSSFFYSDIKSHNSNGTFILANANTNTIYYSEGSNILSDEIIFQTLHNNQANHLITDKTRLLDYNFYYIRSSNFDLDYIYYEPTTTFIQDLSNNVDYLYLFIFSNLVIILFALSAYFFIYKLHRKKLDFNSLKESYQDIMIGSKDETTIQNILESQLKISKDKKFFASIIIQLNIMSYGDISEKQKNIIYEEVKEISKRYFDNLSYSYVISLKGKEYLSCIINYSDPTDESTIISELCKEFRRYNNHPFNIFYTLNCDSVNDATHSYLKLIPLLKYSYLYSYDRVFSLEQLESYEANDKIVEAKSVQTIQRYLTEFKCTSLMDYLKDTLTHIYEGGYSYDKSIDFYNTFLLMIKNFFVEKSIDYKLSSIPLTMQLQEFITLTDCLSYIEECLLQFSDQLSNIYNNSNRKYMENILKYIDENTDNITLSSTSEAFHITSSHLSRVFKEQVGSNFSDYVSEKKLLKAASILKDNQSINISDLASQLGYNTPSYFSSKFKDRFGVTPAAYRKEIINSL